MSALIKVLTVVGARPNFMKAAPIVRAIRAHNERNQCPRIDHLLVHTGQHYDEVMSDRFFSDLGLPKPDVHLGIGSASHAVQTAEIMKKFESVVLDKKPHIVIVVGDVNSTVACALVTGKVPTDSSNFRPLIAHVEAGLRSYDRAMPEEINRIVTDHLSDLLFVTEESGIQNLREGRYSGGKDSFRREYNDRLAACFFRESREFDGTGRVTSPQARGKREQEPLDCPLRAGHITSPVERR